MSSASASPSATGSTSSSAAISRTMPTIACLGAASRIAVAAARHSTPTSAVRMLARPAAEPCFGVIAASGSRETMSRSGLSTATTAANMPPPAAIAMLCQPTTRCVPTANAEPR